MTGGTGSGRSGLGSLPMFSLGASTLELSGLLSRARSPAGFAASLAGLSLSVASVLAGSDLAESGSGLAEPDLAESITPVSALAASRDASFSVAASPEAGRSIFGGSSATGRPRLRPRPLGGDATDARFAVGCSLHRGLPICRHGGVGRRA